MSSIPGWIGRARHLPSTVDGIADAAGISWQRAEVLHLPVAVKKGIAGAGGSGRNADYAGYLPPVVDTKALTGTQVCHLPVGVEKGMHRSRPRDLSGIVNAVPCTHVSAQGAQILHLAVCVEKGMAVGNPSDLPGVINALAIARAIAQRAQVGNALQDVGPNRVARPQ
jgi:hypothetical protein